jgi:hypothetical protein
VNLSRKLAAYTAGAAAAGLAGAEAADGAIITRQGAPLTSGSTIDLDFTGSPEDEFRINHATGPNRVVLKDSEQAGTTNAYVRALNGAPAALPVGTIIGPDSDFSSTFDGTLRNQGTGEGNFTADNTDGNPQYIGVRFQPDVGSPTYYGWIGFDITNATDLTGRVTAYAYEDNAGVPIAAGAVPEPSGLALLALGAPYLMRRRRA